MTGPVTNSPVSVPDSAQRAPTGSTAESSVETLMAVPPDVPLPTVAPPDDDAPPTPQVIHSSLERYRPPPHETDEDKTLTGDHIAAEGQGAEPATAAGGQDTGPAAEGTAAPARPATRVLPFNRQVDNPF